MHILTGLKKKEKEKEKPWVIQGVDIGKMPLHFTATLHPKGRKELS